MSSRASNHPARNTENGSPAAFAARRDERAPKLTHLLSKIGGAWWIAREQAEAELDALLDEIDRLRAAERVCTCKPAPRIEVM